MSELICLQYEAGRVEIMLKRALGKAGELGRMKRRPRNRRQLAELCDEMQNTVDELLALVPLYRDCQTQYFAAFARWEAEVKDEAMKDEHG